MSLDLSVWPLHIRLRLRWHRWAQDAAQTWAFRVEHWRPDWYRELMRLRDYHADRSSLVTVLTDGWRGRLVAPLKYGRPERCLHGVPLTARGCPSCDMQWGQVRNTWQVIESVPMDELSDYLAARGRDAA